MDLNGDHKKHDALDALLRKYLAEREASGMMETMGESVLQDPPKVIPTPEREADMIRRLKHRFPEKPETVEIRQGWGYKPVLAAIGAIAAAVAILLLFSDPKGSNETNTGTGRNVLNGAGTGSKAEDAYRVDIEDFPSLQSGNGTPATENAYPKTEIGTDGSRKKGSNRHSWLHNSSSSNVIPALVHDSRPVSPAVFPPMSPVAPATQQMEPLDPFPLRGLYAQTSTVSAFVMLEPDKDHLIRGRKGTVLHIPKNAFVDANSGEAVTELVQVEIKEVYSRSEFLRSNLPTISNGKQLVSGGAVYLDANAGGRRLALARGKDIYIEMVPDVAIDLNDMSLNAGLMNDRGEMNWVSSGSNVSKMIPLDLDKLYFDEFYCDCQGEKLWNNLLWAISDKRFANTWIATREFRQRMHALAETDYFSRGLMTYHDNVDKDLWKVDKMVAGVLREELGKGRVKESDVARFDAFASQSLGQAEPFDDYGLDLGKSDARKQLLLRKVGREESERLIRIARLRHEYEEQIASRLVLADNGAGTYVVRVKPGQRRGSPKRDIKGFYVKQLGWMNLAKPLGRELASLREDDVKVRLTGDVPYESTRTFVAYSNMLSIVPGSLTTGQLFRFRDVPKGIEAKIVAIGFRDGFPYLGIETLPRDASDQIITVGMRRMNLDDFTGMLAGLD